MAKKSVSVDLPQTISWLLRIATNNSICMTLLSNPVAFATWYAIIGDILTWEDEVIKIQEAERAKKISLERMMKLLSQINYTLEGNASSEHARRILEGYAVHSWAESNRLAFQDTVRKLDAQVSKSKLFENAKDYSNFASNIEELGTALKLSPLEKDILAFAFMTTGSREIESVFHQLATDRWTANVLWTAIFSTTKDELAKAMRPNSPLRLSGILRGSNSKNQSQLATVSPFWVMLLAQENNLFNALLEPYEYKTGAGAPARLLTEDRELAKNILINAKEPGVNLLLYGASSLEKRPVTKDIVLAAGKTAWKLRKFEDAGRFDLPALTLTAFQLLEAKDTEKNAVLVIERPSDALEPAPSEFLKMLFGIELNNTEIPEFDEYLLKTNAVPGIWFASDPATLSDETIARFVFQAPLKKASKAERILHLEEKIASLKLSKKAKDDILKLEGVSSAQIESALKAAKLSGATLKKDRDSAIVQAVKRSQKALRRDLQAKFKPSVTQYSLKYLNTAGKFGPEQILEALRKNPKGTMVLYGPPGTGKTQFVEYMAAELGLQLVAKRASDLLSKWLGESEKNIASAFEEAANEDAILFLDEGDSFLRDRSLAKASWEVTQVNELLQHMERFDGIVVVCTNLFTGLDIAALRRFTFKVEFRELDGDQRWEMFLNETGLKGNLGTVDKKTKDEWFEKLLFMKQLTPGDFATVKRQCKLLNTTLTPSEWLDQLQVECDVKHSPNSDKELG